MLTLQNFAFHMKISLYLRKLLLSYLQAIHPLTIRLFDFLLSRIVNLIFLRYLLFSHLLCCFCVFCVFIYFFFFVIVVPHLRLSFSHYFHQRFNLTLTKVLISSTSAFSYVFCCRFVCLVVC